MDFKRVLLVISITITIIMGFMFGISYGWYSYENAQAKVSGATVKDIPTVIFASNEYIYSSNIIPIDDDDRYSYANKNIFTVTLGENLENYETGIKILLKDIKIADELKNINYKYELLQDGKTVGNGNFDSLNNEITLEIMPMTILMPNVYPKTYTYELYIWLKDDGSNQNNLMNKKFSAKIDVISAIKK